MYPFIQKHSYCFFLLNTSCLKQYIVGYIHTNIYINIYIYIYKYIYIYLYIYIYIYFIYIYIYIFIYIYLMCKGGWLLH